MSNLSRMFLCKQGYIFLNRLFAVAAISTSDVWAVGQANTPGGLTLHNLIEHWNGKQWSIVPSPNKLPHGNNANAQLGVTVSGPTSLWSVGGYDSLQQGNPSERTLTLHNTQGQAFLRLHFLWPPTAAS